MAMWRLSAANARVEEKKKEKEIKPIFARLLLTVNNRRGQNSNSALLPNGVLFNLESFFFLFSLSLLKKKKKKKSFQRGARNASGSHRGPCSSKCSSLSEKEQPACGL